MRVMGIDPGPDLTGFAILNNGVLEMAGKLEWIALRPLIYGGDIDAIAIEVMQNMGMPSGNSVFMACETIGMVRELAREFRIPVYRYTRHQYAGFFCKQAGVKKGSASSLDARLYEALRICFRWERGKEPASLKGASDMRSAFAVAWFHMIEKCQIIPQTMLSLQH